MKEAPNLHFLQNCIDWILIVLGVMSSYKYNSSNDNMYILSFWWLIHFVFINYEHSFIQKRLLRETTESFCILGAFSSWS